MTMKKNGKDGFVARLNEAIATSDLCNASDKELAKIFGISQPMVSQLRNKDNPKFPKVANLLNMAVKLNVSWEWLATGRGPKHVSSSATADIQDLVEAYRVLPPRGKAEILGYTAYVLDREDGTRWKGKAKILREHVTRLLNHVVPIK